MNTNIKLNQKKKSPEELYAEAEFTRYTIDDASPAVRVFGEGPALVFIHGFPTHGYTWRNLLPELSRDFTCYVIDLPGLGDSDWTEQTDFSFTAQARRLTKLFTQLGLQRYSLIAHDTGATIARLVAHADPGKVEHLVAFNTEIPNHRPPWIPTYQRLAALPGANSIFRLTMRSNFWRASSLGCGQFYTNKELLNDPKNIGPYLDPVISSSRRMAGLLGYLRGIEWPVIDWLRDAHKEIKADTLFLWGANDRTFPIDQARAMVSQFEGSATLVPLDGSLLPHEECCKAAIDSITTFVSSQD